MKILLANLEVLALDCQATLSNPETGHLLEIGWGRIRPGDLNTTDTIDNTQRILSDTNIESYLVQLPEGVEITRRVSRITGLTTTDLAAGLPLKKIWKKLTTTAREIAATNKLKLCPTVIHYSHFELPYLHHLHREFSPRKPFPFEIICTHQVMRRLFPNLPRKGLRAIAGYLGHSAPELRRSAHHVEATIFIWLQAVQLLEEQGFRSLEELQQWLTTPLPRGSITGRFFPMPPAVRLTLPQKPGIYRMLRPNGDLLYIGKATSLKNRVNSYFHKKKGKGHAEYTLEMLTQASGLEVIVTGSALEAALLESDEIKRHAPPYNVALRQRNRQIAFFSRDLLHSGPQADEHHPIGPLPTESSLASCGVIGELLCPVEADWENVDIPSLALGIQPQYAPDIECFRSGFELFCQQHNDLLKKLHYQFIFTRDPLQGLMTLGRAFHLKRMAELAKEQEKALEEDTEAIEEEEETEEPGQWVWTPEAVAKNLEHVTWRGAYLIRRARWFCLLSESSLAWDTGETAGGQRRLLVFRGGGIAHSEDLSPGQEPPPPPGYLRPFHIRQKNFDLMMYDRMRVLTTELRRLISDKKEDRK
ncbi:MAG: polymerase subunit epsilon, partial [Acidobacteriota bacterium]|nr:polymerase subunit epsilon [Acidobacteriota bacterium]